MHLVERMLNRAAWFNGVLIPIAGVHAALTKYIDHLVELNDDKTWKFSLLGSTVRIAYRGHYLAVCCRHQLKGRNLSQVGLIEGKGKYIVTSGRSVQFTDLTESDFHDFAVFDFTEPCTEGALDTSRFLPFRYTAPDTLFEKHVFVLCSGFPFTDQRYELDQNHLGSGRRDVICQIESRSGDPALIKVVSQGEFPFDPDGMSGGSSFVCIERDDRLEIYLAGIISRGGGNRFHIVKAGFVREFLDRALF